MKYSHGLFLISLGAAILGICRPAGADEARTPANSIKIASNPKEPDPNDESPVAWAQEHFDEEDGAGPRLSYGRVYSKDLPDGHFGRFETEQFTRDGVFIFGALLGLEGFGNAKGGGGGATASAYVGVRAPMVKHKRSPCFFITLGLGADVLVIDYMAGDFGLGIFPPFASGTAGIELFPGARFLFDARVQYRWQWGAEDRGYARLGFTLSINSDWWDNSNGGPSFLAKNKKQNYNRFAFNHAAIQSGGRP